MNIFLYLQADPCLPIRNAYDHVLARNVPSRDTPTFNSVRSILQRHKQDSFPPLPSTVDDVRIEDEWARTWNDRPFLCHLDNDWGVSVFMTPSNAGILRRCSTIFIDGTFRTAPHPYEQLVTIHGLFMGTVIPLCYCLSTGKTVGQYRQLLVGIRSAIRRYTRHRWSQPDFVVCDFEISLISAIQSELPASRIKCCYFHFTQSLWRKFSETGLVTAYRSQTPNGRRLRSCVQKVMSLGFLPTALVRQAFTNFVNGRRIVRLQQNFQQLATFLQYVSRVYVNRRSLFRPPMWNVYDRNIDTRTNNHVERYSRKYADNTYFFILSCCVGLPFLKHLFGVQSLILSVM